MDAKALYEAGRLAEAIAAATDQVKAHPADSGLRGLLCELLCFARELDRAQRQLEVLAQQDPASAAGITLLGQLIRGEQARRQFYDAGELPVVLGGPCPRLDLHLEAAARIRAGHPEEAVPLLQEADRQRPPLAGTEGERAFDEFRDLDDLTSSLLEVLSLDGRYVWIPMERVERIEFIAPQRPHDLIWRRARIVVGGAQSEAYLPAIYAGSHTETDDRARLGRYTDWRGGDGVPVRGIGQREFLVGDDARSILSLEEVAFAAMDENGAAGQEVEQSFAG